LFRRKVLYAVRHHMPLSLLSQLSGAKFSGPEEGPTFIQGLNSGGLPEAATRHRSSICYT
jgi:hypothetical protein